VDRSVIAIMVLAVPFGDACSNGGPAVDGAGLGASIREIAHSTYGVVRPTAVTGVTELRFPASKQQKRPSRGPDRVSA
jgi:hypothetical protein